MSKDIMNKIIIEESKYEIEKSGTYLLSYNNKCEINIKSNIKVTIIDINEKDITDDVTYNLDNNSILNLNIFDDCNKIARNINVNLNGEFSKFNLGCSAVTIKENKYILDIRHNNSHTKSLTSIHGITIGDSSIDIQNNGYIPKGSKNSFLKQDNKIITMDKNNSKIDPNLYIDEYDMEASHGAYIGKFDESQVFYLKTRGLTEKDSYNLLINGFLLENYNMDDEYKDIIKEKIKKYWR